MSKEHGETELKQHYHVQVTGETELKQHCPVQGAGETELKQHCLFLYKFTKKTFFSQPGR